MFDLVYKKFIHRYTFFLMRKNWVLFLFFFIPLFGEEITVDVTDPVYKDGVLSSDKGGIIQSSKMRVQAQNLELKEVDGVKVLTAKDNLFLIYGKRFFVGDSFTYNFTTKQGVLENGVCNTEGVFIDGQKIIFNNDGTLTMDKALLTTSENKESPFSIRARNVSMDEEYKVKAKGITLSAFDTPVLYFPSYSRIMNKKFQPDPAVTYRAFWERGQGPLFLMRYRAWDKEGLKVFWRGEFRTGNKDTGSKATQYLVPRGAGMAVEIDYQDPDKQLFKFASRNFYAYDSFYNDTHPKKYQSRYRIQGSFDGMSENKKIETAGKWDALSDRNMRSDFPTQLFELQTLGRTEGFVKARYDSAFTSLYVRPRINTFQGFKQELPTLKIAVKPYAIPKTGAIFENYFKLAYLDYVYADTLHGAVHDFRSGRIESSQSLVRPVQFGFLHATPKIGFQEIYYTNGQNESSELQALFHYDFSSHATLERTFTTLTHEVKPYLDFQGLTKPTASSTDIHIFSIQDGFHNLNQLKLGLKNSFFRNSEFSPLPGFSADLYAYNFFNAETLSKPFPKGYLDLVWNYPKLTFQTNLGWNFQKNTYDHTNFALSWTVNEYFAASLELRHRGKFEWKKDNFYNYMLDVARPIDELANSPLSDERTSLFTRWQIQLAPLWTLQVQNHIGWRPGQPFYHESKFDFYTTITNTWKLRLSYMRTVRTNQYSFGITLI